MHPVHKDILQPATMLEQINKNISYKAACSI